jgi:xanthine dehydrogenase iron-sulfur cluster and FAD-binding subunit A
MSTSHLHPVQRHTPPPSRYVAPATLGDAVQVLSEHHASARVIAGGTDLLVEIDRNARVGLDLLIDISRIPGANSIVIDGDEAILGPMVTHNDVCQHPDLVARALPLAQACWEIGSPQLRNRATVAGNVVTASPANDTLSALLALGCSVTLRSTNGKRVLDLQDFITGFRSTARANNELVTEIRVRLTRANERGLYVKLGNRSAQAISVIHLAAVIGFANDGVTVSSARIAVGSVAATVVTVPEASAAIIGQQLHAETIGRAADAVAAAITPLTDVRATAQYRSDTVGVLTKRTLEVLASNTQAATWPTNAPTLRTTTPDVHRAATTMLDSSSTVTTTINGTEHTAAGAVGETLLAWLRINLGLTGTKEGCAEGECGACTVMLDGAAVVSCLVPAARAHGASITTVEGLAQSDVLHPVQAAFVEKGAVQCGYCIPGLLVASAALLDEIPEPTQQQITQGLAGNLCRCTGYYKIIEAVEQASAVLKAGRS